MKTLRKKYPCNAVFSIISNIGDEGYHGTEVVILKVKPKGSPDVTVKLVDAADGFRTYGLAIEDVQVQIYAERIPNIIKMLQKVVAAYDKAEGRS